MLTFEEETWEFYWPGPTDVAKEYQLLAAQPQPIGVALDSVLAGQPVDIELGGKITGKPIPGPELLRRACIEAFSKIKWDHFWSPENIKYLKDKFAEIVTALDVEVSSYRSMSGMGFETDFELLSRSRGLRMKFSVDEYNNLKDMAVSHDVR